MNYQELREPGFDRMPAADSRRTLTQIVRNTVVSYAISSLEANQPQQALRCLQSIMDGGEDWSCRYLLGIALGSAGLTAAARDEFVYISEHCPESKIRLAAIKNLSSISRAA